jgi:hypothetical protein
MARVCPIAARPGTLLVGGVLVCLTLVARVARAGIAPELTLYRPETDELLMDYDRDASPDRVMLLGARPGDKVLLVDADGDTLADVVRYRAGAWYVDLMNDGMIDRTFFLGDPAGGDLPVAGDFLGSGRSGFGVYRTSTGLWHLDTDGDGAVDLVSALGGEAGDVPVVADFDGDGRADRSIYRAGTWYVELGLSGTIASVHAFGGLPEDQPLAADFDGDWRADLVIYRDGQWLVDHGRDQTVDEVFGYGGGGDQPLVAPVDPGGSVFVRAGWVGPADGSQAAPFPTINRALEVVAPGGTIRIAPGSYDEAGRSVQVFRRRSLTFLGAGRGVTCLRGGTRRRPRGQRSGAFVSVASQQITVRNMCVDGSAGVMNQGSSLLLDRVGVRSPSYALVGTGFRGRRASLSVQDSSFRTWAASGAAVVLEGGVDATIVRSSIDDNGLTLGSEFVVDGVHVLDDATLGLASSSVSRNVGWGVVVRDAAWATIRSSAISRNWAGGVSFQGSSGGDVWANTMDVPTGGIEFRPEQGFWGVASTSAGEVVVRDNSIVLGVAGAVHIGGGTASITGNVITRRFQDPSPPSDREGVHATGDASVTIEGNHFVAQQVAGEHWTLDIGVSLSGPVTATIGGPLAAQVNLFTGQRVGIRCAGLEETTICPAGGNVFEACSANVQGCTCPP